MMSRAAQTHLAGHMRPAGRVFETTRSCQKEKDDILSNVFSVHPHKLPLWWIKTNYFDMVVQKRFGSNVSNLFFLNFNSRAVKLLQRTWCERKSC